MTPLRVGVVLSLALASSGCCLFGVCGTPEEEGVDRCDQDRYACAELDVVPTAEGCELEGELTVEIGHGLEGYEPLAAGEFPPTVSGGGGFQSAGAQHAVLGLRIEGAALDRYDVLGARIGLYEASACSELPDGSRMCDGVPYLGNRSVLLGSGPSLNVVDGVVEEFALTMVVDGFVDANVLQAIVEDPCGRIGVAHHDF